MADVRKSNVLCTYHQEGSILTLPHLLPYAVLIMSHWDLCYTIKALQSMNVHNKRLEHPACVTGYPAIQSIQVSARSLWFTTVWCVCECVCVLTALSADCVYCCHVTMGMFWRWVRLEHRDSFVVGFHVSTATGAVRVCMNIHKMYDCVSVLV